MAIEIRAIGPGEIDDLVVADQRGFGGPPPRAGSSQTWTSAELDRTRIAFEAGHMVGVSRTYSFQLTMPGGGCIPTAAVSWVSVLPTHRRRGVLTKLMAAMHDDARERGEPAAILTASESSIYGRFGYGVAAWRLRVRAARADIAFSRPHDDGGRMRLIARDEAEVLLPEIYERARGTRAGMVTRPGFWWEQVFWEFMVGRAKAWFVAVHADAKGHDDGYVLYSIDGDDAGGLSDRVLSVVDMQAETPQTSISLWRFLFAVDLIATVEATNLPVDDPLRHVVVDSRRVSVTGLNDHLWLAPLDAARLLDARAYAVPGRLVIEVHMPDGSVVTIAVEAANGESTCRPTNDAPDLVCAAAVLGMAVLGGTRWSELANAGRVVARRPDVLLLADAMFLANPAPALLSFF
jgi:predicted acetyltransferase